MADRLLVVVTIAVASLWAQPSLAVRLILPGELSKHAISEGTKALVATPKQPLSAAKPSAVPVGAANTIPPTNTPSPSPNL